MHILKALDDAEIPYTLTKDTGGRDILTFPHVMSTELCDMGITSISGVAIHANTLVLCNNSIRSIANFEFVGDRIDLSYNEIQSISGIENIDASGTIDIGHNQITDIGELVVDCSTRCGYDFSHNRIDSIEGISFINNDNASLCCYLELQDNNISEVRDMEIYGLDYIAMDENPLSGGIYNVNITNTESAYLDMTSPVVYENFSITAPIVEVIGGNILLDGMILDIGRIEFMDIDVDVYPVESYLSGILEKG